MLSERANVKLEDVRAELTELEPEFKRIQAAYEGAYKRCRSERLAAFRKRRAYLKLLIKNLESEAPKEGDPATDPDFEVKDA